MNHMLKTLGRSVSYILMIVFLSLFCWCSNDNPTQPPGDIDSVNDYLLQLPSWESFSPIAPDTTVEGQTKVEVDRKIQKIRITTPCSITRTPEKIVTYSPSSEILYIGSLIQGRSYLGGLGAMEELPIRQRAPLTISIDLLFDDNFRIVENPDLASVQQAIGELITAADRASHIAGSSIYFNQTTSHSVEQSALKLGLSAKYMGASVKASLNWNQSHETNTVAAYFIQKMFTTSMVLPQKPADIFSSDFTTDLLDEQIKLDRIGPDNLPVYVSNIVWGRMMMLTMTSTFDVDSMQAALRASYSGISGSVDDNHKDILQQSEIRLVTVGGDQSAALNYLRSGQLGEFFKNDAPLTSAVPISYTLRNLGDNSVAKVCETTKYDMVEYQSLEPVILTNKIEWMNTVETSGFKLVEWKTSAENISKSKEYSKVPEKNQGLGDTLTWEKVTADSLSFKLIGVNGPFTYWDREGDDGYPEGTISIGDLDDWEDDDFDIELIRSEVYAIAFEIGNNIFTSDELLKVHFDEQIKTFSSTELSEENEPELAFIGIISPLPLIKISFDENPDGDDIYIKDFKFGILK